MNDEQIAAQLRHAYYMLKQGVVLNQDTFADHFVSPIIQSLEWRQQDKLRKNMIDLITGERNG